jgi:hypothetical protein
MIREPARQIGTDLDRDLGDGGSPLASRGLQPRNCGPVRFLFPGSVVCAAASSSAIPTIRSFSERVSAASP